MSERDSLTEVIKRHKKKDEILAPYQDLISGQQTLTELERSQLLFRNDTGSDDLRLELMETFYLYADSLGNALRTAIHTKWMYYTNNLKDDDIYGFQSYAGWLDGINWSLDHGISTCSFTTTKRR
jgi:hypothetical protein